MEMILGFMPPVVFFIMLFIERKFAAVQLPKIKGWTLKGCLFFTFTGLVNAVLPMVFAMLLGDNTLFHLNGLNPVIGALLGFAVADFFSYWFHRATHVIPWLWRWTHQMHHSAERMDLAGMTYTHPFDTILAFTLGGFATMLLGLSPEAAGLAGMCGFFAAVVQHMNIRTPSWLGYFVMRPEAHGLHHERGIHAYNYGNMPLWDIVFGTFRNPENFPAQYGFWDGASKKLGAMMVGRDVGEQTAR